MTGGELWQAKLAQLFHDPFIKAFCQGNTAKVIARDLASAELQDDDAPPVLWDAYAQDMVAALLSKRLLDEEIVLPIKRVRWAKRKEIDAELEAGLLPAFVAADLAASGADRPNIGDWRHRRMRVQLWKPDEGHFVVTHPLSTAPLELPAPRNEQDLLAWLRPAYERLDIYRGLLPASREQRLQLAWYLLWRRLPEDLATRDGVFWSLQPADTRCPDHSIWDHLRVTSSLAFIPETKAADENVREQNLGRRPWLLSLWVGPARDFVGQARTGRDLWTGSMLLSELAWALIEPVARRLGADAILYPDLRANPRADRWITEQTELGEPVLEGFFKRSYASLIPNRLVALVPEKDLDEGLAEECLESARARWRDMAQAVRTYLSRKTKRNAWQSIFDEQVEHGPSLRWSAVRWEWDGRREVKQEKVQLDPAIPFQDGVKELPKPIREIEEKRAKRFQDWIAPDIWDHYQAVRQTSLMTHASYLLGQRGFDYAPTHHQLLELDAARARLSWKPGRNEPGEKCTLCGARQALSNAPEGTVGQQRNSASVFWMDLGDEGDGAERLCGPCAVRRFLSNTEDRIKRSWEGPVAPSDPRGRGRHDEPFPSTGLIAGQLWLQTICKAYADRDAACRDAVREMVESFRRVARSRDSGLKETQFPDSLARTRRLRRSADNTLEAFLRIDIQYMDPDKWDGLDREKLVDEETAKKGKAASNKLRKVAGAPKTRIAVIALDGDRMGRLLLGDPDVVKAPWKDVLHPDAVDTLRSGDQSWKVYWRTTMERPRLMGPSTHAFVTRALREFANRILPWVVERVFGGRLIYAGGDDALILCPADEAMLLLVRLHDFYTSAWVLDRAPGATAWPDGEPLDVPLYEVGSGEAGWRFKHDFNSGDFDSDDFNGNDGILRERRIVPMLGAHQSFSAGIAFGHYKTSLRLLRSAAFDGLREAKASGRCRAGLSWFTRNGAKLRWTAPLTKVPGGVDELRKLAEAFAGKQLPGRLPYKLRELTPLAATITKESAIGHEDRQRLLENLVKGALDGATTRVELVTQYWMAGLERREFSDNPDSCLDGLLFARALGGLGEA